MRIDLGAVKRYIDEGLITCRAHPSMPIDIYNYTPRAQYENKWDHYTSICRGLIADRDGLVIANPFPKFFNFNTTVETKPENLPAEMPVITEKIDGAMGIFFVENGQCAIATRGAFESPQAQWATKWIREKGYTPDRFNPAYTYIFEIVFPGDQHVVQYGDRAECVLLAVRNTDTGQEYDHIAEAKRLGLSYARLFEFKSVTDIVEYLKTSKGTNEEGFACRYSNGLRVKVKSEDYLRMHRLFFQTSTLSIWESLMKTGKLDDIINNAPDEIFQWVKKVELELRTAQAKVLADAEPVYAEARKLPGRKEQAEYIKQHASGKSGIVFLLLDRKLSKANEVAWKLVRPVHSTFRREDVESA